MTNKCERDQETMASNLKEQDKKIMNLSIEWRPLVEIRRDLPMDGYKVSEKISQQEESKYTWKPADRDKQLSLLLV